MKNYNFESIEITIFEIQEIGGIYVSKESIRALSKKDQEFYLNEDEKIEYCEYCIECARQCKESHRIKYIHCPIKIKVHTPLQYEDKIKRDKRDDQEICNKLGINTKSFRAALRGNRDFETEWHVKLEKELYGKDIKVD